MAGVRGRRRRRRPRLLPPRRTATSPLDADTGAQTRAQTCTRTVTGGGWSSRCSRPTTRACTFPPTGLGWRAGGGPAADGRSGSCWPGWAGPCGCSRAATGRCGTPSRPSWTLDTAGAFGFLRQAAPLLQAAGFGVQLPRWAGRKAGSGLKLTTRTQDAEPARPTGSGVRAAASWSTSGSTWRSATRRSARRSWPSWPGSRCRWCGCAGQWVELDDRQLKAALKAVERERGRRADRRPRLLRAGRATAATRSCRCSRSTPTACSATCCPARPSGGCAVADAGRLRRRRCGRTRSAGWPGWPSCGAGPRRRPRRRHGPGQDGPDAGAAAARARGGADAPTLLVCPMSVVGNWQREAARFAPDAAGAMSTTAAARQARRGARRGGRGRRPGAHHLRHGCSATWRRSREVDWDRVVWTRRRRSRTAAPGRRRRSARIPARHPARADRHAGREPPRRALVDHGVPQPRPARAAPGGSGERFEVPIEARRRRGRRRAAQAG